MKRLSIAILAAAALCLLLLAACSSTANEERPDTNVDNTLQAQETGFASPEEAIIAYLEALREADLERMLAAFAIDIFAMRYDLEALLNRLPMYTLANEILMPNANELVTAMNIERRRAFVVNMITMQHLVLSHPELELEVPHRIDSEDISDFVTQFYTYLNALDLQSIEIIGFIPPEEVSDLYLTDINQDNIAQRTQQLGADQLANRVVVFELGGRKHMLFVETASYDGEWYIMQFAGNLSALMGFSQAMQGIVLPEFVEAFLGEIDSTIVPI